MPESASESFEYLPRRRCCCAGSSASRTLTSAALTGSPGAVCAAGALLGYIKETQKFDISHINRLDVFYGGRYMEFDWVTRRNLELTESLRSGEKKGSLLWVLDKTKTPMGGRMLRSWNWATAAVGSGNV